VTLYHLHDHPPLTDPLMIVAFDAWVDAGTAATTAARIIAEDAEPIAGIEADGLYDYRARRPTLHIEDGRLVSAEWPRLQVLHRRFERRDALVLSGPEPDYRWRELSRELVMLASDLGITEWMTLGAIPAAVPHTRPVTILGTASADGLLKGDVVAGPTGSMRVPAAAVSIIDIAIAEAGIPALGYFAQVPHYVTGGYAPASLELVRVLEQHLAVDLPRGELEEESRLLRLRLDAAVAADETTRTYVERLETMVDESRQPAGDDLIADSERFLRDRSGNDS
jgi:hypothetical protein